MLSGSREVLMEVIQSIVPICAVVLVMQFTMIGMPTAALVQFVIGAVMVLLGLFLFLQGARIGLLPVGEMIGSHLPNLRSVPLVLLVALAMGFAITAAEPDVRVLAYQVETISAGELGRGILIPTVALGVGLFLCLALSRVFLGIPIAYLLAFGYLVILLLLPFTPAHFVPVAFDAGGVTTGPMTVPFMLALGFGFSSVLGGKSPLSDGFGFVGLASIGPIIAVMLLGVLLG